MGVLLRLDRQKAFLREGVWRSANQALERRLNEITHAWILASGGPSLSSADPEAEVAREVARQTGAKILIHSPGDARESHRAYFAQRQYKLELE